MCQDSRVKMNRVKMNRVESGSCLNLQGEGGGGGAGGVG